MATSNYEYLKGILDGDLFVGVPSSQDISDKVGLIACICYLTNALKQKKPGINHYQVIRMCTKDKLIDDKLIEALSLMCHWFSYGCTKFPDMGLKAKDMPEKIRNGIANLLPF